MHYYRVPYHIRKSLKTIIMVTYFATCDPSIVDPSGSNVANGLQVNETKQYNYCYTATNFTKNRSNTG